MEHFPQPSTRFAVLDARSLATRHKVTLPGTYSFDARSTGGRGEVELIDLNDGGAPRRLFSGPGRFRDVAWSPDDDPGERC